MPPDHSYTITKEQLNKEIVLLLRKKTRLAWFRFTVILVLIAALYYTWFLPVMVPVSIGVLLLALFIKLIFADTENSHLITHTRHLIQINEDELKALGHDYYHFAEGEEFRRAESLYANDLDIFGRASLFQYTNRTTSELGSHTLAGWLQEAAEPSVISARQSAVKELAGNQQWQQEFQATGREQVIKKQTQLRLQQWLQESNIFLPFTPWRWLRYLLPAIMIMATAMYILDRMPLQVYFYFLMAFGVIAYNVNKKVSPVHEQLSKMVTELDVLSASISLLEKKGFSAPLLISLQQHFSGKGSNASLELKKIKNVLERLDLRYNLVLAAPLNILLLWSLQQVISLERWKEKNKADVVEWFNILGYFEALNSFAILSFNHPEWTYPVLHNGHFFMEGRQMGHPLINKNKRVQNEIKIDNTGQVMLVTGSNMAGKSTYLRSVGINIVLAMAGGPVCAAAFILSPVKLVSSMRIADNLEESTSTFYAELKKLKTIIELVNRGEKVFILLDEILRGTNSLDRHTGSVALVQQLIKQNAVGIIATHDVELAKLKERFPANILNYHFDAQVQNEELYFDYLLKPGICTSLNASILMKKIGIEL